MADRGVPEEGTATLYVEHFPAALRRRAKIVAARDGTTLRAVVEQAVAAECDRRDREHEQAGEVADAVAGARRVGGGPGGHVRARRAP